MIYLLIISVILSIIFSFEIRIKRNYLAILPLFYNLINMYSLLGLHYFTFGTKVPFNLDYNITNDDLFKSSTTYILASIFFYLGSKWLKETSISNFAEALSIKIKKSSEAFKFLIVAITITSLIFGYGLNSLLARQGYIDTSCERNKILMIIYTLTLPISSMIAPFFRSKILSMISLATLFILSFGTTARMLILVPVFYFLGDYIKNSKSTLTKTMLLILSLLFVFTFSLEFRNNDLQGIIYNTENLINNGLNSEYLILGLNYIFSFSFLVLSNVIKYFHHDSQSFLTSISPLPSSMLDINQMLSAQSLTANAPFSSISILALAGMPFLAIYYFITSLSLAIISNYFTKNKSPLIIIIIALYLMFAIFSVQYNLRGATRLIYYAYLLYLAHKTTNFIKRISSHNGR